MCKLSICKEHEFVSMNGHPTTCEDEWGESSSESDLNTAIERKVADTVEDNPSIQLYYKVVHL